MENLNELIVLINELTEDRAVPRNVKDQLKSITEILSDESREKNISINEAKDMLSELSEDQNLQTFSRTQIFLLCSDRYNAVYKPNIPPPITK